MDAPILPEMGTNDKGIYWKKFVSSSHDTHPFWDEWDEWDERYQPWPIKVALSLG